MKRIEIIPGYNPLDGGEAIDDMWCSTMVHDYYLAPEPTDRFQIVAGRMSYKTFDAARRHTRKFAFTLARPPGVEPHTMAAFKSKDTGVWSFLVISQLRDDAPPIPGATVIYRPEADVCAEWVQMRYTLMCDRFDAFCRLAKKERMLKNLMRRKYQSKMQGA
ncbi:hypothetical protein [Methanofollis tationis]|uniref:Uncharacterized protein n=1 Tax=Methanofollis tationis TaxID=81417 RepID=A0A7K4HMD1_9EURY|nr:hypothetical protein [Methanofollis tationis]NVO66404.1 hypothetical protein [Methanofollis tationis]